jgi:hypothetical protein
MEAMRVIHEVHDAGGKVAGFTSWCGGLPAPEANTNPFGYKFSWSPRGVLLASKNSAKFLKDGRIVTIPAADLFAGPETIGIPGLGEFEGYPNRDSVSYRETYGIPEAQTVFRGTLRYPGWCETVRKMVELGLLDDTPKDRTGVSFDGLTRELAQAAPGADTKGAVASRLGLAPGSAVLSRFEWLGLFGGAPLPVAKGSALENLTALMMDRLGYEKGERDMVVLQHEFLVRTESDGREDRPTLVDYGVPGGDSSVPRTVKAAAIGFTSSSKGDQSVRGQVPVRRDLRPDLNELEAGRPPRKRQVLSPWTGRGLARV